MDLKKLENIMKLMRKHKMHELAIEDKESGEKLSLKAEAFPGGAVSYAPAPQPVSYMAPMGAEARPAAAGAAPSGEEAAAQGGGPKLKASQRLVKSPFVGTFYIAPSPGADPFVKIGHKVKRGDVLCIIEAMKLMNEIEAESDGVVVDILVQNEQPVEYDQPLFIME